MSPEYEKADVEEMLRQLQKYFERNADTQEKCILCDGSMVESAVVSYEKQVVSRRIQCEDEDCPVIEQDFMVRKDGSEWVVENPPWSNWDPESYDGPDEKLVWFLIALQTMHETPDAKMEVSGRN